MNYSVPVNGERVATGGTALQLAPGQFFGGTRLARSYAHIAITHRIAVGLPEEVITHTHLDAHFILVTGGEYVSSAEGTPGSGPVLIYNPPGTTHRDHFARGRGSFFAISLTPDYAALALSGTAVSDAPRHLVAPAQRALALCIAASCAAEVADLSLDALCLELLGSMDAGALAVPASTPAWLERAVELLRDRCRDELSVAEIAAAAGVHPVHLARTFRRHLRCTPGQFMRFYQLEHAASMLLRTARPLAEVALCSGFADQSHFSRVFTRHFGLPPGKYRVLAS